ncbi:hypothetical protein KTC93_09575 [Clostridium tagluense]|nr:hypothetical protein [Clostridium tagluense]WLC67906.1 hypothetical protein KTC93_09575 [Clostridium tagluense]
MLTTNRNKACCVDRAYVRKVCDYFNSLDECNEKREVMKIDMSYINSWEKLHDSCIGHKRPEDLVVCYLSGPEPQNDFTELISLGIHPQNIWAFENNSDAYNMAVDHYNTSSFPQPKIVKGSIEQFFKHTPKKFDIVYIDACGAIASEQHCLRIIASLCKYHRLNSPGIVITNFASPDTSKREVLEEYSDLIAKYLIFKKNPNMQVKIENSDIVSEEFINFKQEIMNDFQKYYGDLVTTCIRDIASVVVPIQRFTNSMYLKNISEEFATVLNSELNVQKLNYIKNNSLYKFFYMAKLLKPVGSTELQNYKRFNTFIKELSGLEDCKIDILDSFRILNSLKTNNNILNSDIRSISDYFKNSNGIYQFLDKPNSNLLFDLIVNQLAYPLHYNSESIKRYKYKAKKTDMFMDIVVFDECRYIYEWLPTMHQIVNAFSNLSWQYVFRFALDGLVKQRINYNNEYFFQGSVVSKDTEELKSKLIVDRLTIT